jgi:hypothetical protein
VNVGVDVAFVGVVGSAAVTPGIHRRKCHSHRSNDASLQHTASRWLVAPFRFAQSHPHPSDKPGCVRDRAAGNPKRRLARYSLRERCPIAARKGTVPTAASSLHRDWPLQTGFLSSKPQSAHEGKGSRPNCQAVPATTSAYRNARSSLRRSSRPNCQAVPATTVAALVLCVVRNTDARSAGGLESAGVTDAQSSGMCRRVSDAYFCGSVGPRVQYPKGNLGLASRRHKPPFLVE